MMLPAAPKDVGRLSDVFIGALGAISNAVPNVLSLPKVKSAVVVLVDGLGVHNLREHSGHARNLSKLLSNGLSKTIRCGFPSTTAVSITSFGTGLRAGEHGVLGYQVADSSGQTFNHLTGWDPEHEPEIWQPNQTIAERADLAGILAFAVAATEYEKTGFTKVTMRGAKFHGEDNLRNRALAAGHYAKTAGTLVYLYYAELDQSAHRYGVGSKEWLATLEEIDASLGLLEGDFGLLITADHGIVNVPTENHVYLEELEGWCEAVTSAMGDPRALYCYGNPADAAQALKEAASSFSIVSFPELIAKGWVNGQESQGKIPDFVLIATSNVAFYDRRFAKAQSLRMIGQHGSISDTEMQVPLIRGLKFA